MQNQTAEVDWRSGDIPVSRRFDDPYFSLENGLEETRHVFLSGNGLPGRFRDGFLIAELGFGSGLNFLATVQAWEASPRQGRLRFTSFEAFPMRRDDMERALAPFSAFKLRVPDLLAQWQSGGGLFTITPSIELEVVVGDARATVPDWDGRADAWYLDGFSPAKNPEMWGDDLMREVGAHTAPGGTCATYTAAGFVRRALQAAGFEVARVPGFGRKRHMTRGIRTA